MQNENHEFLTRALAKLGFDGVLDEPLRTAMTLGTPEIKLSAQLDIKDGENMKFDFSFKHKEETDRYFLNNVLTTLNKVNAEPIKHDFFLYRQQGYDIREMKNMLEGRSVFTQYKNDSGDMVQLWRKIDFTAKDERQNNVVRAYYNNDNKFNLDEQFKKLPFASLTREEKEFMQNALKRGDQVPAVLKQGASKETMYLVASPDSRSIQVFNQKGVKVSITNNQLRVISEGKENKNLPEATKDIARAEQQQQEQGQQQSSSQSRRRAS
jgi:hypothetical protein